MGLLLVTGNRNKLREAQAILGAELANVVLDLPEKQSMDVAAIARYKAAVAYAEIGQPVIVEDVAVEIACLNGFPGPLVKWWEQAGGYESALIVAAARNNFRMNVISLAAYTDGQRTLIAQGRVRGKLVPRRGEAGWGFDFYFQPLGQRQTYAEMGPAAKNATSHRFLSFSRLRQKLLERGLL